MTISIILDPQILFVLNENQEFHINMTLVEWINRIGSNHHFYLLIRNLEQPSFLINSTNVRFQLSLQEVISLLKDDAREFLLELWNNSLKFATLDNRSPNSFKFSDGNTPFPEEILVITPDKNISQYLRTKVIVVATPANQGHPLANIDTQNLKNHIRENAEVYCDFDDTLSQSFPPRLISKAFKNSALALHKLRQTAFIQEATVELLKSLQPNPLFLITQRDAKREEKQPVYSKVNTVIRHLARTHNLSMRNRYFLNGIGPHEKGERYLRKAEHILKMMAARQAKGKPLPKHIVLIDDQLINEIAVAMRLQNTFKEKFGIELIPIWISNQLNVIVFAESQLPLLVNFRETEVRKLLAAYKTVCDRVSNPQTGLALVLNTLKKSASNRNNEEKQPVSNFKKYLVSYRRQVLALPHASFWVDRHLSYTTEELLFLRRRHQFVLLAEAKYSNDQERKALIPRLK
jgi:hypothetical protein